jgi:hypothetical protein
MAMFSGFQQLPAGSRDKCGEALRGPFSCRQGINGQLR